MMMAEETATDRIQIGEKLEASLKEVSKVAELQHHHEQQLSLMQCSQELLVEGQRETHQIMSQLFNKFTIFEKGLLPAPVTAGWGNARPNRSASRNAKDVLNARVSTVRTATATTYEYLEVHTRYQHTPSCDQSCTCVCHAQRRTSTPESLRSAMGRLFMGYSGFPMLARACGCNNPVLFNKVHNC